MKLPTMIKLPGLDKCFHWNYMTTDGKRDMYVTWQLEILIAYANDEKKLSTEMLIYCIT